MTDLFQSDLGFFNGTQHMTDIELKSMALEIDARDGNIDGRMAFAARKCAQCGKGLMSKQSKCQYCGADNIPNDPFQTV